MVPWVIPSKKPPPAPQLKKKFFFVYLHRYLAYKLKSGQYFEIKLSEEDNGSYIKCCVPEQPFCTAEWSKV